MSSLMLPPVIAHRGASGYAPENTLAAFITAKKLGAEMVEFDVALSADKIPIVFHDERVERTSNGFGKIVNKTVDKLKALDAGSWFSSQFKNERIPTFSETLSCLIENKLQANIEIKPTRGKDKETAAEVLDKLSIEWPQDLPKPLLSSFSDAALEKLVESGADYPLGYLMHEWHDAALERAKFFHAVSMHLNVDIVTIDKVKLIKNHLPYVLVYTVNDPIQARELFDWGVDAVFTDYPDKIIAVI